MTEEMQLTFEKLVRWCGKMYTGLPLTFLLGFYVSLVVKRYCSPILIIFNVAPTYLGLPLIRRYRRFRHS